MRISELSARSGVSIASIKYYLREGLLTSGQQSATNQADYGEYHAKRLRLIRSLIDIGGLSISKVRATLAAMEDETAPMHHAFGAVMHRTRRNSDRRPVRRCHGGVRRGTGVAEAQELENRG